ncbi:MAG: hypothetical protein M3R02_19000 [Chloroflexota bacterium]|nr:hypothetical protein [Chloroflexota bacterium]
MKIVHSHSNPGIPEEIWVKYLTNGQLKRQIRRILKGHLNIDRSTNAKLDLLLSEAEQREGLREWTARCLDLLAEANAFSLEEDPTRPNTLVFVPRRDQAAS